MNEEWQGHIVPVRRYKDVIRMKEKVEQYAKGEYDVHRPKVEISIDQINLNIAAGTIYEGSFLVRSANEQKMKAMIYDSRYLFKLEPHNFVGREQTVNYSFDARKWEIGERISGTLYLVTDGGEYNIPYEIEVMEPTIRSSIGSLSDMFQFASLAETNWGEAVRIFSSQDFKSFPGLAAKVTVFK